jgi:hypothetical protein
MRSWHGIIRESEATDLFFYPSLNSIDCSFNMARPRKEAVPIGPQFTVNWTNVMTAVLWKTLVDQHNLGKRADTGWKPESWNLARDAIQEVYVGAEGQSIDVTKVKAKVDYVCICQALFLECSNALISTR